MTFAIDSGLTVGGNNPTINVQVDFDRTSPAVGSAYLQLVQQMQAVLQQPPAEVNQASADQLSAAINGLRSLAVNGLQVPAPDGSGNMVIDHVTKEMAKQIDLLSRSLRAAGIVNSQPTVAGVREWQDLATQGLNDIFTTALQAYNNNNSIQAMIELEYVQAGNDLLQTQLNNLNTAIQTTSSVTNLLGQVQTIHNMIAPATPDTSNILLFTNPQQLVATNQQTIFNLMSPAIKSQFNITSPSQITPSNYEGTPPTNLDGIKQALFNDAFSLNPTVSIADLNNAGIYSPDTDRILGGQINTQLQQEIFDNLSPIGQTFWGITNRDNPTIKPSFLTDGSLTGTNFNDFINETLPSNLKDEILNDPGGPAAWQFWYTPHPDIVAFIKSGQGVNLGGDTQAAIDAFSGLRAYLSANATGTPNQWKELFLDASSTAAPAPSDFTRVAQSVYGQPIKVVVNFGNQTDSQVLQQFIALRTKLSEQLTMLDQLNPPPASGRDPSSLGGNIVNVLNDMNSFVPTNLNPSTDGAKMIAGLKAWIIDNQNSLPNSGSQADQTAAQKVGTVQSNLQNAITAATNLNDTQQQQLQQFIFIFDEFYKSASSMLTSITQNIQTMAQNAGR